MVCPSRLPVLPIACLLELVSSTILPTYYLNLKDQHKSNNFHLPSLTPNSTSNPQSVSRPKPLVVFTPPRRRQLPLLRLPPLQQVYNAHINGRVHHHIIIFGRLLT